MTKHKKRVQGWCDNKTNIKQLNIKFENLVENPKEEILKIYNFCGIDDYDLNQDCKLIDRNIVNKYKDYNLEVEPDHTIVR